MIVVWTTAIKKGPPFSHVTGAAIVGAEPAALEAGALVRVGIGSDPEAWTVWATFPGDDGALDAEVRTG
jgi:hypothetical protein